MPKSNRTGESPTKAREKVKVEHVMVVGAGHRLAAGLHSTVFPEHAGEENHWHGGGHEARNGHGGSFHVTSNNHRAKGSM